MAYCKYTFKGTGKPENSHDSLYFSGMEMNVHLQGMRIQTNHR